MSRCGHQVRSRVALAIVVAASACGGGQTRPNLFSAEWEDDSGRTIEEVRRRLAGARPPKGADVAVGVAGHADKLVGVPLDGSKKWVFAHPISSRPIITGSVVVGAGGSEVFALDALTGTKLWVRDTGGLALRGAGDDGSVTVMTFSRGTGKGAVLLAVQRDGTSVRQIEVDKELGTPAVVQGLAFVPWASQYISVVDLANGDEAARVTLREQTTRAFTSGGALYFGEVGFFRFDHNIKDASRGRATHLAVPRRTYAGEPRLMFSGQHRLSPLANAQDKVRLFARPGSEGVTFASNRYYATYFRYAMGFDADGAALRWVHTHASDLVGGAAADGALVVCDENGKVTSLDERTGSVSGEFDLGEPVRSCVVQADGFHVPPAAAARLLADQLEEAIGATEVTLAPAQSLFLKELAELTDERATKTLVALASEGKVPELRAEAGAALARRRSGVKYLVEALGKHYDYLKDVLVPPPVGAIAHALVAMNEGRESALVAAHLLDPQTSDEDVKEVATALAAMRDPAALPAMKTFFAMYRGAAESEAIVEAVVRVGKGLLDFGGADGHALVVAASKDELTLAAARERLAAMLVPDPKVAGDAGAKD